MKKILIRTAVVALVCVVGLAVFLRVRYGGGQYYADLSTEPLMSAEQLEVVLQYSEPVGNIAVNRDGRVFFTIHPESRPKFVKLLEWKDGRAVPYPSEQEQSLFDTPLGMVVDRQNRLWVIDHGTHGLGKPRLFAFDLETNQIVHDYQFPAGVAQAGSFMQDLTIDSKGETVYIADVSFFRKNPALVVYDIASKTSRRVLESDPSVYPQDWIIRTPTKDMIFFAGLAVLKPGVDGIVIDTRDEWVYFGAMAHDTLYRVRAADLRNAQLSPADLSSRVEAVCKKPLSDGLSIDTEDNVFITDVEHGSVMQVGPDRQLKTTIRSPKIRWADSLKFGPDGWLYLADSAIPEQMLRSRSHIAASAPYFVFRFKPGTAGVPGV